VEVGGSITTMEGVIARFVEIGKRGKVRGLIRAERVVIGKEASVENIYGKEVYLKNGAIAKSIYGEHVKIEPHCHILGELHYTNELKIGENVTLAKEPQKVNKIPF